MTKNFIKTGVIGHPIAHSKSPLIHRYWIVKYGLSGSYEAIDIAPNQLKQGIQDLIKQGYGGFNVTIPHKETIIDLCDEVYDAAAFLGAVNTVTIKDGKLHGSNTDILGFAGNLKRHTPDRCLIQHKKVLILGAGGAALAAAYSLLGQGVTEILICNRTQEKAERLAQKFENKPKTIAWQERNDAVSQADLIVNTTSLGMKGQPPLEIDLSAARRGTVIYDIVYAPLMTDLLIQAQKCNLPIITGIGMLLHQARPGFKAWHDIMPDVSPELEKLVLK